MEAAVTDTKTQQRRAREVDPSSMRAAVLEGAETMAVRDMARTEPDPHEVCIRLEGCGVCASDLPVWEGRSWFEYPQEPGAPGHEGWGHVEAIGSEVEHVDVGDRVAALSYHAYAECDVAHADEVVMLPSALDDHPFPGEPLGCAMNVFRRSDIQSGHTVAVVGVGFLGALLVGLVANAGARVIALSRRPFALEMAERFGAERTIAIREAEDAAGQVQDATGGDGCDRVIEATGKQAPLNLASQLVRVRGRLVIAGYHQDGSRTVDMQSWNWRGIDVVNAHERDPQQYIRGMREAVEAIANGRLDPSPLYTHTIRLEALSEAFRLMQERPAGFMKALISL